VGILTPPTLDDILRTITNGDLIGIVNVTAAAGAPTETQMPDLEAVAARAPSFQLDGGAVDAHEKCQEVAEVTEPAAIDQATRPLGHFLQQRGLRRLRLLRPQHQLPQLRAHRSGGLSLRPRADQGQGGSLARGVRL
jgi:hypothetical protein